MNDPEPRGCLAAIFGLFGLTRRKRHSFVDSLPPINSLPAFDSLPPIGSLTAFDSQPALDSLTAIESLPYRQRDDFLSPAELSFYRTLTNALGGRVVTCCKVNLADIVFVSGSTEFQLHRNRIDRKHVDFLLCDPLTMRPCCAIELDDSSHTRRDRQERDDFVNRVFEAAGLPLVRVPARRTYVPNELIALLDPHLEKPVLIGSQKVSPAIAAAPLCPKCGVVMVERIARKGANAGTRFLGCPNYPKCREILS